MYTFTGSSAGSMPDLNGEVSGSGPGFNIVPITQSWAYSTPSLSGSVPAIQSTQDEFYNGEFSGSAIQAANQILNPNCQVVLQDSTLEIQYNITVYEYDPNIPPTSTNYNWTSGEFLNYANPSSGEIFIWYDSGSSTVVPIGPGGQISIPPGGIPTAP